MAIAEYASGSVTLPSGETSLISGTTTLSSVTDDGVFQVFIDLSDMGPGDLLTVKIKEKVISSGAQKVIYQSAFSGTQQYPFVAPSLILMHGWDVTVEGTTGTVLPMSIRRVA